VLQAGLTDTHGFAFQATGFANRSCRIESRAPDGDWRLRATVTAGADGSITYRENTPAPDVCEFYRLVWE
jgi:hypothetical protein